MIKGIGTDLTDQRRIQRAFNRFGDRFVAKVLCSAEIDVFRSMGSDRKRVAYLTKQFAAKEAVVKESSIAPDKGNKMIGSKDVTAIGITSVIHQIETHAVDAKTALAWGFNPSG